MRQHEEDEEERKSSDCHQMDSAAVWQSLCGYNNHKKQTTDKQINVMQKHICKTNYVFDPF